MITYYTMWEVKEIFLWLNMVLYIEIQNEEACLVDLDLLFLFFSLPLGGK